MKKSIQKALFFAGIIATAIAIFSFATGISSIPSLFDSPEKSEAHDIKATKNLLYFFLDNYDPNVVDKFTDQILAKDRDGMIVVVKGLLDSSREIRRSDTAKEWKYLIEHDTDNITNSIVARIVSILAKERNRYRKIQSDYLSMITHAFERGQKKNNVKVSTGRMDRIDSDFLKSIGAPILDFPDMPQYYFCDDTFYTISKDRVFDRFYSSGLTGGNSGYLMEDGWDYDKVANDVCSKHLLVKSIDNS